MIGQDNRVQVLDTTVFPGSAITYITTDAGSCSGWMISVDTVATAGHCVHGGPGGSFASNVKVYPGRDSFYQPYGVCNGTQLLTVDGWAQDGYVGYDYGAIKLDCNVGNFTGAFGFKVADGPGSFSADLYGYPGDKPTATQWGMIGDVSPFAYGGRYAYDIDTAPGQSGAPVYAYDSDCGTVCGRAVHAYGAGVGAPGNSGTGISGINGSYDNFLDWRQ